MATFPTLSVAPIVSDWDETAAHDPTIRNETDGGYVITGARFTRKPPKKYHIKLEPLPPTDKGLLESLEEEIRVGAGIFTWTNPNTAGSHDVRLKAPIRYRLYKGTPNLWTAEFDLEEV